VATIDDPAIEEITNESYGALKALCERTVSEVFGARALNVRPGLIVGPFDPTDRFTYWPRRVARGGTMLAPAGPDKPTQWIDARDLAAWILRAAEGRTSGTFNATGEPVPFGDVLGACVAAANNGAAVEWVSEEFLLEQNVGPWMELPLWIPGEDPLMNADISRAVKEGLMFRQVIETVRDTMTWALTQPERPARAGLDAEKERKLLEAWRAR
jgi:2'-hydroxyisoflavone reductase